MIFCEQYQRLDDGKRFEMLNSVVNELAKVNSVSYPNIYAQLTSSESKRRIIQLVINEKLQQSGELVDVSRSIESTIETE